MKPAVGRSLDVNIATNLGKHGNEMLLRAWGRYDFVYKQSVMTEDTFLGMAGKTPGSQVVFRAVISVAYRSGRRCIHARRAHVGSAAVRDRWQKYSVRQRSEAHERERELAQ